MSRPESVSSSTQSRGSSSAICRISLRFFSPPEKPTLTPRRSISCSMPSLPATSRTRLRNSGVDSSASPRFLRCALSAVRRNVMVATPGISSGYWKARNRPLAARSSGARLEHVLAVEQHLAFGHLVVVLAGEHVGERRLARAVRAHDGVHLPLSTTRSRPLRICLPSTSTCRFLTSSKAIATVSFVLLVFAVVVVGGLNATKADIGCGLEICVLDACRHATFPESG